MSFDGHDIIEILTSQSQLFGKGSLKTLALDGSTPHLEANLARGKQQLESATTAQSDFRSHQPRAESK